jgi:hypothetical protein
MSLSAAAFDPNKVATDDELKQFFPGSPFRKTQRLADDGTEDSEPSLSKKASVNSETFGTLHGPIDMTPDLAERLEKFRVETDLSDLKRVFSAPADPIRPPPAIPEEPSRLQVEENKEEDQRADELRHNVAVRRANLALQREMHPYLIRVTAVKYLRLVTKLKDQIAGKVTSEARVPKAYSRVLHQSFVKGVEETLDAMEKKLALLIEEQNEELLPTPADLAAQVQQVLGTLAETFETSQ